MANPIRDARVRLGISVTELARRCGVSRQAARAWDFASSWPKPAMLVKVAEALEVDIAELNRRLNKFEAETTEASLGLSSHSYESVDDILRRCKTSVAGALNIDQSRVQIKVVLDYE